MTKNILGLVSGIVLSLLGIFLILLPFFIESKVGFISWIYGPIVLLVGVVILFNLNKEDKIEEIKSSKK